MNPENGMSSEANELVNAGRQAFRPTEADRARLMAAVTATATLTVAGAITAGAQHSLRGIFGFAHAARLLVIVLPVATVGAFWLHAQAPSPATVQLGSHVQQHAAVAPTTAAPPLQVPPAQAVEQPAEPSAPVSPDRTGPSVADSPKAGHEIRAEVALLSKAQAALSRGRYQEALQALAEHAQRFPRGVLAEERAATRARTLCALGRRREAAAELKRMETVNPTSAYLARARESCAF